MLETVCYLTWICMEWNDPRHSKVLFDKGQYQHLLHITLNALYGGIKFPSQSETSPMKFFVGVLAFYLADIILHFIVLPNLYFSIVRVFHRPYNCNTKVDDVGYSTIPIIMYHAVLFMMIRNCIFCIAAKLPWNALNLSGAVLNMLWPFGNFIEFNWKRKHAVCLFLFQHNLIPLEWWIERYWVNEITSLGSFNARVLCEVLVRRQWATGRWNQISKN